ncbi:MAG: flagellar biosynthesis protein FlhF [bacterium]|nr:flagellar biosynthesis protein FlhF [bacterium]
MQIKKYEAVDMPSAIKKIKSELGSDAVILSTRTIRKGDRAFGMFGRAMVEVTAAVDWAPAQGEETPLTGRRFRGERGTGGGGVEELSTWLYPLKQDIHEIRAAIERLQSWQEKEQGRPRLVEELTSNKTAVQTHLQKRRDRGASQTPPLLKPLRRRLALNDVDDGTIAKLLNTIQDKLPSILHDSPKKLEGAVRETLAQIFTVQGGLSLSGEGPKKVALIGPTGAGKTTTIAKLAAAYALTKKKKVALVTIDTYRIAAIEQLKIYAEIIGIPVDVVVREKDLDNTIDRYRDKDLVLIDTAGRSHRNLSQMRELERMLGPESKVEKHLVLNTTLKRTDMASIIENYRPVGFDHLLFSKIDEGSSYGTILDAVLRSERPVSYLTDGQRVPEDLREASVKDLVDLVLLQGFIAQPSEMHDLQELEREPVCPR